MRRCLSLVPVAAALTAALAAHASPGASQTVRDCDDFTSQRQAQLHFHAQDGPGRGPDRLDPDGNGLACDALPCPCSRVRPSPRRRLVFKGRITGVSDGDTIRVRRRGGRRYRIQLIGVDTPEMPRRGRRAECGARDATGFMLFWAFTRPRDTNGDGHLDAKGGRGRSVTVKTDPTQRRRDRAGRLLAYVYSRQRNLRLASYNLGATAVIAGKGKVRSGRRKFRLYRRFRRAQRSARARRVAVWTACRGNFHRPE